MKKAPFFSQNRFPKLWTLFQYFVGGVNNQRNLVLKHYAGQKKILEIGCSVGLLSKAFVKFPNIEFTGIDIDNNALSYARERFKNIKNFNFINMSLSDLSKTGKKFDYVLFPSILHHVDDVTAKTLLKDIQLLLSNNAILLLVDPKKNKRIITYSTNFGIY